MALEQFNDSLKTIAVEHAAVDFDKMYDIARHLHENPGARADFAEDPTNWVYRFNGLKVQDGHHLHIADENNTLIPAEEYGVFGADDRTRWGRSEIRVGYKTTSLVDCA